MIPENKINQAVSTYFVKHEDSDIHKPEERIDLLHI